MKSWSKLLALPVIFLPILLLLLGLYVGTIGGAVNIPGLSGGLRATAPPPSPEVKAQSQAAEKKIETVAEDRAAFYLELTDQELTALLASKLDSNTQVRDLRVHTTSEEITFSGSLNGVVGVPCSGAIDVIVKQGRIHLELKRVSIGIVGVPGETRQELESMINQTIDLDGLLRQSGATQVQQVRLEEGKVVVVGVQPAGTEVPARAKALLQESTAAGKKRDPEPPGANVVPPGAVASMDWEGDELYLALGDSLAANVGVANPRDGYVSRFHSYLERQTGRPLGLLNLGNPGESSISIYQGQLTRALVEIERRRNDGNPATRVSVVTLDLGANDLLGHVTSQDCLDSPDGPVCQARVDAGLATFRANFEEIVSTLLSALGPDTQFYIMTIYNPYDLGTGLSLEVFSNEVVDRLNSVIKETARANGVLVADVRPLMSSNAGAWTHVLAGDIHPNARGYQALAFSLAQAHQQWKAEGEVS
jgi:lysophospholipase L1-like esterase